MNAAHGRHRASPWCRGVPGPSPWWPVCLRLPGVPLSRVGGRVPTSASTLILTRARRGFPRDAPQTSGLSSTLGFGARKHHAIDAAAPSHRLSPLPRPGPLAVPAPARSSDASGSLATPRTPPQPPPHCFPASAARGPCQGDATANHDLGRCAYRRRVGISSARNALTRLDPPFAHPTRSRSRRWIVISWARPGPHTIRDCDFAPGTRKPAQTRRVGRDGGACPKKRLRRRARGVARRRKRTGGKHREKAPAESRRRTGGGDYPD